MYKHILLATDGSNTANAALREALKFAKNGAQLTAITVVDNPLTSYGLEYGGIAYNYEEIHQSFIDQAKQVLQEATDLAQHESGIKIHTVLVDLGVLSGRNDISSAIEKAANQYHADLIVIGTHGRSGFKHFFLGSVAEQLIRQTKHPILIIRKPETV